MTHFLRRYLTGMGTVKNYLHDLMNLGCDRSPEPARTQFVNLLSMIFAIVAPTWIGFYLWAEIYSLATVILLVITLYMYVLLLNKKGRYTSAKYLLIYNTIGTVLVLSFSMGPSAHHPTILIVGVPLPFFMFQSKEKKHLFTIAFSIVASFVALILNNHHNFFMVEALITADNELAYSFLILTTISIGLAAESLYFVKSFEQAQASDESKAQLIDYSHQEIYIADCTHYEFVYANTLALGNSGYTGKDLKNLHPWDLDQSLNQLQFMDLIEPLLEKEKISAYHKTVIQRKNGTYFSADVHLQLAHFLGKECIVLMINDRTRVDQLEQEVKMNSKLATLGELAAGIGHEINNPVAIIKGYQDQIEKLIKHGEIHRATELIQRQDQALKRISVIVNSLQSFSYSKETVATNVFNGNKAVQDTVSLTKGLLSNENIDLTCRYDGIKDGISANQMRLQQVLLNLITNAKDALQGRSDKQLTVRTFNKDHHFCISVTDNGSGIDPELHDRIFDAFYTTKEVGKGTGLGLGISKRIIEEMGGQIYLNSELNKGTTFTIELPAGKLNTAPQTTDSERWQSAINLIGKTVLLAEDEPDLQDIMTVMLEDLGLQVDVASDGRIALDMLGNRPYDILITDLKMPELNGNELVEAIYGQYPDLYILVVTGGIIMEDHVAEHKQLVAQVNGFLNKPVTKKDLHQALAPMAGSHRKSAA